jgi:hypothetical protein
MAWRRAGRLLVRHCQALSRPPPPPPWPGRADCLFVRHCQAPSRLPPFLRHGQATPAATSSATARPRAGRRLLPHGQATRRPLPLPPWRSQAAGSRIAAEEGSASSVVGAQSGPMGLMGRRALPCLRPGHDTRGISAVPGPPPRPGGPTRPDTEVHHDCIVSGRVGPGQIGLGPG